MARCKECIHHDVCETHEKLELKINDICELEYRTNVDTYCKHFKSIEDVVSKSEVEYWEAIAKNNQKWIDKILADKEKVKQEVEGLKKENETLSASNKTLALSRKGIETELIKAKQEVALQIINEFKNMVIEYVQERDLLLVAFKNAVSYAETELKKKYIGE